MDNYLTNKLGLFSEIWNLVLCRQSGSERGKKKHSVTQILLYTIISKRIILCVWITFFYAIKCNKLNLNVFSSHKGLLNVGKKKKVF